MKSWTYSGQPGEDLHDALRQAAAQIRPSTYLEIGVDGGGSLKTVLSMCHPKRIILADCWNPKYSGHGITSNKHIKKVLGFHKYTGETIYLDGDSKETIPKFILDYPIKPVELILIDGDHSLEGALTDLLNCWPLLADDGVLVVDDIGHPNYPDVEKAVNHFSQGVDCEFIPEATGKKSNCVIMRKKKL
jgi:Methyltransferase domain